MKLRDQRRRRRSRKLRIQGLENRRVLATYTVTTSVDVVDDTDSVTSLREAILAANENSGADEIRFDSQTLSLPGEIDLTLGQLDVTDSLHVFGPGADQLVIDGQNNSRVLSVAGEDIDFTLESISIVGGRTTADNSDVDDTNSGAGIRIAASGNVLLSDVMVLSNQTDGAAARGAGIYAVGSATLTLMRTTISDNATLGDGADGAGLATSGGATAQIFNTTFSGNHADGASVGGAINLDAGTDALLIHTTVTNNTAPDTGGIVLASDAGRIMGIFNSIVAANTDNGSSPDLSLPAELGTFGVNSSLIGDNLGTSLSEAQTADPDGNLIGSSIGVGAIAPLLNSLAFNAGTILTHQPESNSPTINAGDSSFTFGPNSSSLPSDARGLPFERVVDMADMGAFETQPPRQVDLNWDPPAPISIGTALSETQLNATAPVPGSFVYTPALDTVLDEGVDQTLTVVFTPDLAEFLAETTISVTIDVVSPAEYGDAPDSYGTLAASGGAKHPADSTLTLGTLIDAEADGQPGPLADGDGTDDDGVNFLTGLVADSTSATTATISVNLSSDAKLDAWIDFDGNGVFDSGEHIGGGISIDVGSGDNLLPFTIPAGATPGTTFARFRVSTDGGLLPTGDATDGEVEDYAITLLDSASAADVTIETSGNQISLLRDGADFVIQQRTTEIFRAPNSSINRFEITADKFSNVLTIDHSGGDALPTGGLQFDGGDQVNTLRWIGDDRELNLTETGSLTLLNVDAIDLSDETDQSVIIDATAARAMDPTGGGLVILGSSDDRLSFADGQDWRMRAPEVVAGTTFNTIALDDTFVQFDVGSGWQNLARPSDINNQDGVTASDALRIINELANREFSNEEDSILVDPATVDPWPDSYLDQNGDGKVTALDALRVINELSQLVDGEQIASPPVSGEAIVETKRGVDFLPAIVSSTVGSDASRLLGDFELPATAKANTVNNTLIDSTVRDDQDSQLAVDQLFSDASFIESL